MRHIRGMLNCGWTLETWKAPNGTYTAHLWKPSPREDVMFDTLTGHGKTLRKAIKKAVKRPVYGSA